MRSTGHSLESAIADIIDNSLSADAKSVWINFSWNNGDPWIAIIDDGYGMNQEELENAMRLGSKGPDDFRRSDDLGRFGLGLKTA
jgi:signal transduction histidine kinase